jgi:hypothetical protein
MRLHFRRSRGRLLRDGQMIEGSLGDERGYGRRMGVLGAPRDEPKDLHGV